MTASSRDEKHVRRSIVDSLGIDEATASRLTTAFLLASVGGGVTTPVLPSHARRSSLFIAPPPSSSTAAAAPLSPLLKPTDQSKIPAASSLQPWEPSDIFTVGLGPRGRRRSSVRLLTTSDGGGGSGGGSSSAAERSPKDKTFSKGAALSDSDAAGVDSNLAPFTPLAMTTTGSSPGNHATVRARLPSLFEHTLRMQSSFALANTATEAFGGDETSSSCRRSSAFAGSAFTFNAPATCGDGNSGNAQHSSARLNRKQSATKLDERQRQAATRRARNFAKSLNSLLQRQQAREGYGTLRSTAADIDEAEMSMERELRGSSWFTHVYLAMYAQRLLSDCLHQRAVRLLIKTLSPLIVRSVFRRRRNAAIRKILEVNQQQQQRSGTRSGLSTTDLVRSSMILAKWPLELLEELRNAMVPFAAPQGVCVALAGEPQAAQNIFLITNGVVVEVPNSEDRRKFAHCVWNTNNELRTPDSSSMRGSRGGGRGVGGAPSVPAARSILPFLFEPYRNGSSKSGGGGALGAKSPSFVTMAGNDLSRNSSTTSSRSAPAGADGQAAPALAPLPSSSSSSPPGPSPGRAQTTTTSSPQHHHHHPGHTSPHQQRGSTSATTPPTGVTVLSSNGTALGDPASAAEAMQLFSELQQWSSYTVVGDVHATLGFTCRRSIRCWTNVQGYAVPRQAFAALFDRLQPSARADAVQAAKSAAKSSMATVSKPSVQELRNMHAILAAWPTALLVQLQGMLMPLVAIEGEVITRDVLRSSKLYVMVSGLAVIDAVSSCDRSIPTRSAVASLGPKTLVGLSGLVMCDCPTVAGEEWTLRAKSFCELWTAPISDLERAHQQFKVMQPTVSLATDSIRAVAERQLQDFLALIGSSPSNVSLLQSKQVQGNMFGCLMGILKAHLALQSLPERALARLARMLRLRVTFPGERLMLEKTTVKEVVVVFSGSVTLTRSNAASGAGAGGGGALPPAATATFNLASSEGLGGGGTRPNAVGIDSVPSGGSNHARSTTSLSTKEVFPRTVLGLAELCAELPCDYTAITDRSALVFTADRHEVLDAVSNAGKDFSAMYAVLERCEILTGKKSAKAAEEERAKRSREIEALEREAREKELQAGRDKAAERVKAFHAREVAERHAREASDAALRHIPHNAIITEREEYLKHLRLSFQRLTVENRVFASMSNQLYQYVQNEEAMRRHQYYSNPLALLQPVVTAKDATTTTATSTHPSRENLVPVLLPDGTVDLITQELAEELWHNEDEQRRHDALAPSQRCPVDFGTNTSRHCQRRSTTTTGKVHLAPDPPCAAAAGLQTTAVSSSGNEEVPASGDDPQQHNLEGGAAPPPLRIFLSTASHEEGNHDNSNKESPRFDAMESALSGFRSTCRGNKMQPQRHSGDATTSASELFSAVLIAPLREQDAPPSQRAAAALVHGGLVSKVGSDGVGGVNGDVLARLVSDILGDDAPILQRPPQPPQPPQPQQRTQQKLASSTFRRGTQQLAYPVSDESSAVRDGSLAPTAAVTTTSPRSSFSPQLSDMCVASTDLPDGAITPPGSSFMASPAAADYASTTHQREDDLLSDERVIDVADGATRNVRQRKRNDAAFLREARRPRPLHTQLEGILPVPPPVVECSASVQHRVNKLRETVSLIEIGDYDGHRTKHFIREALVEPPLLLPPPPQPKKGHLAVVDGGAVVPPPPPTFGTQLRYVVNPFPHVPHRPSVLVSESGQPRIGRTLPRSLLQASSTRASMHHAQLQGAAMATTLSPVLQIKSVERLQNPVVSILPDTSEAPPAAQQPSL